MVSLIKPADDIKKKTKELLEMMIEEDEDLNGPNPMGSEQQPDGGKLGENQGNVNQSKENGNLPIDNIVNSPTKVEGQEKIQIIDKEAVDKTCIEGARHFACEGNELEKIDTTNNTISPIERLQLMLAESKRKFGETVGETIKSAVKLVDEVGGKRTASSTNEKEHIVKLDILGIDEGGLEDGKQTSRLMVNGTEVRVLEKDDEKKWVPGARRNAAHGNDTKTEHLLLPKELYNEIKAMGSCKKVDVSKNAGVSYADALKNGSARFKEGDGSMGVKENVKEAKYKDLDGGKAQTRAGASSKIKLKYYSSVPGMPIEDLIPDEAEMERLNNCLVGHFLGARLSFYDVEKELFEQWGKSGLIDMWCSDNGIYLFEFQKENAIVDILEKSHCHVFGKVMVLKRWHQMLKMSKEVVYKVPIWIKLYGLPLEFWSEDNLSKIASRVGRPLYTDVATERKLRVSYARVCVEIDAAMELPASISISHGGENVEITVEYQWVPKKCEICKVFGHNMITCPQTPSKPREHGMDTQRNRPRNQWQGVRQNYQNPRYKAPNRHYNEDEWRVVQRTGSCVEGEENGGKNRGSENEFQQPRKVIRDRNGKKTTTHDLKKVVNTAGKGQLENGNSFKILASIVNEDKNVAVSKGKSDETMVIDMFSKGTEGKCGRKMGLSHENEEKTSTKNDGTDKTKKCSNDSTLTVPFNGHGRKNNEELGSSNVGEELVDDNTHGKNDMERKIEIDGKESENIVNTITPSKLPKGLSFEDYPSDWSRKKIKKEIKAVQNALKAKKERLEPP